MFNSTAFSHVRLNLVQNLGLNFFEVETEYTEFASSTNLGSSYQFSLKVEAPSLRAFNVVVPVLRYYQNHDGSLDITYNKDTNMAWVDWMYNIHKLDRYFLFNHPVYGTLKVRFKEPLKVPKGLKGGQACVESLELRLIEIPSDASYQQFNPRTFDELGFDFPFHCVSSEYQQEGTTAVLGGNYTYAVRGAKPEQRKFTLYFKGMKYYQDGAGKLDPFLNSTLNMGALELFYKQFKLSQSFYYNHPVYGKLKVRFNNPLKVPKLLRKGDGWVGDFQLELIEEVEDATRYC